MTRIFATGGHTVVFGQPNQADGGTFTVNYASGFSADVVKKFQEVTGLSAIPATTFAFTDPKHMTAYVDTSRLPSTGMYTQRFHSQGGMMGRVTTHEAVTHGFLQQFVDYYSRQDIPNYSVTPHELALRSTSRFDMDDKTKAELAKLCEKKKNPVLPPPRTGPIIIGLPDPPGGPGGGFPRVFNPGGPSALDWLHWLADRERERIRREEEREEEELY